MSQHQDLKRTPLHGLYARYGARLVPFGGWEMPVQFSGIMAEHEAVRRSAGLFDVSHMGEIWIEGLEALAAVQWLTINDASRLSPGQVQYSAMATPAGGLVDDLTVYCFARTRYMLCVNAANIAKDLAWIREQTGRFSVTVYDRSGETALLALQGPRSQETLAHMTYINLDEIPYYGFRQGRIAGLEAVVSRTGYTGEDGFELFIEAGHGPDAWQEIMAAGESCGVVPCGLGARDTLRLEMGYALYGQDIDETTSPIEAGLGWITNMDKRNFLGRDTIALRISEGLSRRLAAIRLLEPGIPRHGYGIYWRGNQVGTVTSGTLSPSLKIGIALGYLPAAAAALGTEVTVKIREKDVPAAVVKLPFYLHGSVKRHPTAKKEA